MAMRDGLVQDERREVYAKSYAMRAPTYLNLLMTLATRGKFPSLLLKVLVSSPIVKVLNSRPLRPFFKWFYRFLEVIYKFMKRVLGKS
jgi:hypothetical protein